MEKWQNGSYLFMKKIYTVGRKVRNNDMYLGQKGRRTLGFGAFHVQTMQSLVTRKWIHLVARKKMFTDVTLVPKAIIHFHIRHIYAHIQMCNVF